MSTGREDAAADLFTNPEIRDKRASRGARDDRRAD